MNFHTFEKMVLNPVLDQIRSVLGAKGKEYARSPDRFANFKRHATEHRSPLSVLEIYKAKHQDSIKYFLDRHEAILLDKNLSDLETARKIVELHQSLSEPIEGRFIDDINYSILALGLIREYREDAESMLEAQADSLQAVAEEGIKLHPDKAVEHVSASEIARSQINVADNPL